MASVLMDVQPIDQGAVLRSGQAAVPNYAEQAIQRAMLAVNEQNARTANINATSLATTRQREADRQDAFGQAVQAAGANPTAEQLAMLAYRFPEFSEAIRRGWQTMDEATRRREFQQAANITAAARSAALAERRGDAAAAASNYALATRLMRERVEADRAAGHEDPNDAAILAALENPDSNQRRYAVDLLERITAAADPERYAQTYGTFQRRTQVVDNIVIDQDTGQPIAQSPYPRVRWGPDGASAVFNPVPGIPRLGVDPVEGGAAPQAPQAPQAAQPAEMAPPSGEAPAFQPAPEGAPSEFANVPYGNPLSPGPGPNVQLRRVRSRQEYERLAPGTPYIDPQGNRRIKR